MVTSCHRCLPLDLEVDCKLHGTEREEVLALNARAELLIVARADADIDVAPQ